MHEGNPKGQIDTNQVSLE